MSNAFCKQIMVRLLTLTLATFEIIKSSHYFSNRKTALATKIVIDLLLFMVQTLYKTIYFEDDPTKKSSI